MMRKVLLEKSPAALVRWSCLGLSDSKFRYVDRRCFSDFPLSSNSNKVSELPRVDSLVDGCDYKHWLVVMHPPDNYPGREEIVQHYVGTLSRALGSEKAAMESIYSVSTKYYYAFGCKVTQSATYKIKLLPQVKWVLPDSYLATEESSYGGEPYIDGKLVTYEEKYHAEWLHGSSDEDWTERTCSKKHRRKRSGPRNSHDNE